jgi:hypothetical protein
MARFGLVLLSLGMGAAASFGCSSLLGDFTTSGLTDSGPPSDGSNGDVISDAAEGGTSDNFVPEGGDGGGVDAVDAEAGPLQSLTCNTWKYPQPFMVANLAAYVGTGAGYYQGVNVFSVDPNTVRVVASRSSVPAIFTVYSVDKTQSPPAVTSVDLPYNGTPGLGQVWSVPRLPGGFGIVTSTTAGGLMTVSLYPFLDAQPITPLPQPIPIAQLPEGTTLQRNIELTQVGPSAYFVAIDAQDTTNNLEIGVATGGQRANPFLVDSLSGLFDPVLVHVGSSMFMFIGIQSAGGAFYQVPDTASAGGARQTIPPLGAFVAFGAVLDAIPGSAPNTTNLAYEEFDFNDAGQFGSATFRASAVANATLPALKAADITFFKAYTDLGSFPATSNGIRFFGDDFVVFGPGQDGNGDPTLWVNFLWMNVNGVVRGDQEGVNGLLSGHGPAITYITGSPSGAFAPQSGAWNVGWAESLTTDAGGYAALFLNELDCN